jgi:hypothetical protein
VNEALAAGIPAMVSDLCGCAEDLVSPLDPRLVFPCGHVDGLADLLEGVGTGRLALPDAEHCHAIVARHDISVTVETVTREYANVALDPALANA